MSNEANRTELPPDRITANFRRVKEHRVAQWTIGYVALAYAVQHAVTLTSEAYQWPNLVARLSMTLLVLGLPVAMTLAWYHGDRVNRRTSGGEAAIVSLLLVLISLVFYVFVRPAEQARSVAAAQEASVTAARTAAASPKGAISVAVLPFVNLSSDKEQEFFSDGMTEEITAALAKVPDLRVVARTSAFEFKGKNVNIKTMGQELGATHLIEGSVRKAGNRVRITAQLIKADDGTHIWAEDYDRELTDVFAIQEDIARAITASLHMTLGLKPGENLVNNRAIDPESYQQFLRAVALIRARGLKPITDAAALLEQVVARNPDYAPAWAELGQAYDLTPNSHPARNSGSVEEYRRVVDEFLPKAEAAFRRALQLDPNLSQGYSGLGTIQYQRGKIQLGEELYFKALALDPNSPDALHERSERFAAVGRLKEALAMTLQLRAVEPFVPVYNNSTATILWLHGQNDDAIALAKTLPPGNQNILAAIYASLGLYGQAADTLERTASGNDQVQAAARLLRSAPARAVSAQNLPRLGALGEVYLYVGAPDRFLDYYEFLVDAGRLGGAMTGAIWLPSFATVRKSERFKAFVRKAGFVDDWRAKGWPPQCHPTTGDDFECG